MQVIHPSTWPFSRSLVPLAGTLPTVRKLSSLRGAPQPVLLYFLGGQGFLAGLFQRHCFPPYSLVVKGEMSGFITLFERIKTDGINSLLFQVENCCNTPSNQVSYLRGSSHFLLLKHSSILVYAVKSIGSNNMLCRLVTTSYFSFDPEVAVVTVPNICVMPRITPMTGDKAHGADIVQSMLSCRSDIRHLMKSHLVPNQYRVKRNLVCRSPSILELASIKFCSLYLQGRNV